MLSCLSKLSFSSLGWLLSCFGNYSFYQYKKRRGLLRISLVHRLEINCMYVSSFSCNGLLLNSCHTWFEQYSWFTKLLSRILFSVLHFGSQTCSSKLTSVTSLILSQALECLVRLASVRRSLFSNDTSRVKYLAHLMTGTKDIMQTGKGE